MTWIIGALNLAWSVLRVLFNRNTDPDAVNREVRQAAQIARQSRETAQEQTDDA